MHKKEFLNARILVVDDDPQRVRLIAEMLNIGGFREVRAETDSAKAASGVKEWRPDLVILDLHMAPYDGFEVLAQIEPLVPQGTYLPVLVLTGDSSKETKERALSAGAMDFVAKPFNVTEILLRVKNLLHTRLLHLQLDAERERLEERVNERTLDLLRSEEEMLNRLAHVAEYRDDSTGEHTKRVGAMVEALALEMGIEAAEALLMGKAALLHDIGKVALPDELLLKPGQFSPGENEEVKRHADIGGEILKGGRSKLLAMAERAARYHHERWDGTGYVGLEREAIPLEARITAVADVYDALTTARPYKQAWTKEAAVSEIERHSGTHFDPAVVEAFLRLVQRADTPPVGSKPVP